MELLHNFVIRTGLTIVNNAAMQRVWQTGVIDLALEHKFLMHTLLSLSAMHLAHLRPSESAQLSVLAAHHQDLGLAGFRSELQNIDENNCHALFASSILVILYVPASSGTTINKDMISSSFLNDTFFSAIMDWIRLIRGCHHVILRGRTWLERGPTANLVPREAWHHSTEPADERSRNEDRYLASLERLWAPDTPANSITYDDSELEAYQAALTELRHSFGRMSVAETRNQNCSWCHADAGLPEVLDHHIPRVVAGVLWSMMIPNKFFELMEQRKPVALVLLAHNAIILKRTSDEWWNKTPAMKIMAAVTASLSPDYAAWIEWPQREVGYTGSC